MTSTVPPRGVSDPVVVDDGHLREAIGVFWRAMVGLPFSIFDVDDLQEPGRVLAVFDGKDVVGTANSYASSITVPGGAELPHAAVTHVGVKATHQRKGIARALLARQLECVRDAGDAVATLRASQPGIYERFGYGVATLAAEVVVDTRRALFRQPRAGHVQLREAQVDEVSDLCRRIYDVGSGRLPGTIKRSDAWWRAHLPTDPTGQHHFVVHGPRGREDGFVSFRPVGAEDWFHSKRRTVVVDDFVHRTDAAYFALLQHVIELDLVDRVVLPSLAVDDPIADLLGDFRAVDTVAVRDETWLRLVDVPSALAGRTYGDPGRVVIEVSDDLLPENEGRYLVTPEGVKRTDREPDLSLDVAALGAAYLGRPAWRGLVLAGRVHVLTPGALEEAEHLFVTTRAPHSGTIF